MTYPPPHDPHGRPPGRQPQQGGYPASSGPSGNPGPPQHPGPQQHPDPRQHRGPPQPQRPDRPLRHGTPQLPGGPHGYGPPPAHGGTSGPAAPGGFGPPPKKRRAGLIAAIAGGAVAVILVPLAITAFWAPGFLVDDGPEEVAERAVAALSSQDSARIKDLACDAAASGNVQKLDQSLGKLTWTMTGDITRNGDEARVPVRVTLERTNGDTLSQDGEMILLDVNGWCVSTLERFD